MEKTLEMNVGKCGSELHRKVQLGLVFGGIPHQYSAGGDPYIIRLVITEANLEKTKEILKREGVMEITELEGNQGF